MLVVACREWLARALLNRVAGHVGPRGCSKGDAMKLNRSVVLLVLAAALGMAAAPRAENELGVALLGASMAVDY